jgi:alanine-glyoxylate transaminase / serine-glyoxylate transaminase / serine-pyruvate transaminase
MMIPERLLLGPGPSPVSPRVMQAMASPVISHVDPAMMAMLADLRQRLAWAFGAGDGAFSLAVSGTGTSGMEAAVANVTRPGMRARRRFGVFRRSSRADSRTLRRRCLTRAGRVGTRVPSGSGRSSAVVHGETSTGVVNPVEEILALAAAPCRSWMR